MALEWVALTYLTAAEAVMVLLLTLPGLNPLRKGLLKVTKNLLQPLSSIIPFCIFLLLDIYWKYEHMPIDCSNNDDDSDGRSGCGPIEYLRYEKSLMKSHRNFLLVISALLFYWVLRAITEFLEREEEMKWKLETLKKRAD